MGREARLRAARALQGVGPLPQPERPALEDSLLVLPRVRVLDSGKVAAMILSYAAHAAQGRVMAPPLPLARFPRVR